MCTGRNPFFTHVLLMAAVVIGLADVSRAQSPATMPEDPAEQAALGDLYCFGGPGVERDYAKAMIYYQAASRAGNTKAALGAGAEALLLDNMPNHALRECVALAKGRAWTEASGGVSLDTVREIAETGVDRISIGALTHSAPSLDLALDFE